MKQRFNNLDELRLILAVIVVFRHIIVLSDLKDLYSFLPFLSSEFAVSGFFVLSGFLVFSAFNPGQSKRYAVRRLLRIYPAYVSIIVLATLFGLAHMILMTEVIVTFNDTMRYLASNLVFLNFIHPNLGNLFADHYQTAVNGALWTIKIELTFYLIVPALAFLIKKLGHLFVLLTMVLVGVFWPDFISLAEVVLGQDLPSSLINQLPGYLHLFAVGIALSLVMTGQMLMRTFIFFCLGAFVALEFYNSFMPSFYVIILPAMVYLIMQLPALNLFNRNDFSYGIYLAHFPVTQFLFFHFANSMPDVMFFVLAFSVSILFSIMLWYLIERPLIQWSKKF
jgi:peptidoglycan/LPS O-acetylase OafA/YrhL